MVAGHNYKARIKRAVGNEIADAKAKAGLMADVDVSDVDRDLVEEALHKAGIGCAWRAADLVHELHKRGVEFPKPRYQAQFAKYSQHWEVLDHDDHGRCIARFYGSTGERHARKFVDLLNVEERDG